MSDPTAFNPDVEPDFGHVPAKDTPRKALANKLNDVALDLHEKTETGGERVKEAGHAAADKIESTARYLREHSSREMLSDVEALAKKHPVKSMMAIAVVGFLAGRVLRRD